jgi:hypothetical protein
MKRTLAALATIAAGVILATGIPSQASTGTTGVGIQLLDGTAPNTGWMQAAIPQGGARAWHVKIINVGSAAETVAAVASSALGFYAGGPARQPASTLQSWITRDKSGTTVLAPGQSVVVAVTVTVPAGARLGLVPGYAPGSSASLAVNTFWGYAYPAGGGQIKLATAAGVRMYITVTKVK